MTPAELVCAANAVQYRQDIRRKAREADLYLLAAMVGQAVWGKLPNYEEIFGENAQEMTDEEMFAQVRAINAALGGKDFMTGGEG